MNLTTFGVQSKLLMFSPMKLTWKVTEALAERMNGFKYRFLPTPHLPNSPFFHLPLISALLARTDHLSTFRSQPLQHVHHS